MTPHPDNTTINHRQEIFLWRQILVDFPVEGLEGFLYFLAWVPLNDLPQLLLAVGQLEADLLFFHPLSDAGFHPFKEVLEKQGDIH